MTTPLTSGSYLFRGPSDQTIDPSFRIKTNEVLLTEQTILVRHTIQIIRNKDDLKVVHFE